MFEAYAIGITLKLNNLVSPQLDLLSRDMMKLDGVVAGLNSALKRIGTEVPGIRALTSALGKTNVAFEQADRRAAGLQARLAAIRASTATMPPIINHGMGGGGGRAPGLPAPGGGGSHGGGGGNYGNHGGGFHGGNIHMGPGGIGMGTIGMGAGDAFLPLAVGAAMVYAGHSLYEAAKDLNTEQQRFKLFGLSDKVNAEAFKFVEGMKVYGSTQAENMKNFREAQGVFRESGLSGPEALEGAKLAAPYLSKIAFATEALDDESKAKLRTSGLSMLRWVEMAGGLQSPQRFNELANFGWKMTQTSGGNVDWEAMRQFSATSGNAGRYISLEGMAALEPLLGELKGGGAGTGLRTAMNRLTGVVRLPNQVAHLLADSGLWDASKVEWNKAGGVKQFNGNPFTAYKEFANNPAAAYEKYMMPLYEKMHLSEEDRGRENSLIFGGTGGRLFTLLEKQLAASHKSVASVDKALGIDQSTDVAKKALSGQEKEFISAWTDFKTAFGTVMLPSFSNMLKDGAVALRAIGDFVKENAAVFEFLGKAASFVGKASPFSVVQNLVGGAIDLFSGKSGAEGRNFVAKPSQSGAGDKPVSLVLTQGGRPLAQTIAGIHSKAIATNLGSGTHDLSVSQPAVNLRTN